MYYGLILLSVVMFGGCFALNDTFRKMRGSSFRISLEANITGGLAGLIVLLAVNAFRVEYTPFTLIMALLHTGVAIVFSFCSFRALDSINLSLYSLFSMLGGMLLPFVQGILFYHEGITAAKLVCLVLIILALHLTVQRGERRRGGICYACIFVLNGMSGVLSKIFTSASYAKTSAAGYSILCALCSVIVSLLLYLILSRSGSDRPRPSAIGVSALSGSANKFANFLLVIALAHVDASGQYPMVTGGVMIVSTLICFFGPNKPSRRELISVLFAFIGMLALFVIPV